MSCSSPSGGCGALRRALMFHRTQNLLLRPAWPEDWQMVHAGIADHGVVRNLARAPWPYQPSDARSFVECMCEPMFPRFLVTRDRKSVVSGKSVSVSVDLGGRRIIKKKTRI